MNTTLRINPRAGYRWRRLFLLFVPLLGAGLISACGTSSVRQLPPGATQGDGGAQLTLVDNACLNRLAALHAADAGTLAGEIAAYQPLVEEALVYRQQTIAEALRLKAKLRRGQPLSGADLDILNQGMQAHLALRERLYAVAEAHECWTTLTPQDMQKYLMTPSEQQTGVMLSLSAALVLYDNYLLAVSIFDEDTKLRRFLNAPDKGYQIGRSILNRITLAYNSPINRARVRAGIHFYEQSMQDLPLDASVKNQRTYLHTLIQQSPSYNMTRESSPLYVVGRQVQFLQSVGVDELALLGKQGLNLFSMFFGNSVGLVETRRGKLYRRPAMAASIQQQLRAGDILLEKTPFRLTDMLIPGFWGHAAIWIGSEPELKALGIWNHPLVTKYHKPIRQGHVIVEALRPGVRMNPLEHFLNIDDMAILRVRNLDFDADAKAAVILQALRQVGKAYDFNFDVETTDTIVCSELIYQVYTAIDWPTQKALGRATISPDHIAQRALNGGPLQLVAFYRDGARVDREPLESMALLVASVARGP